MKTELQHTASMIAKRLAQKRELFSLLDEYNAEKTRLNKPKEVIKFNAEDVLFIEKLDDKIVFLERGIQNEETKRGAGYKHILTHAEEFKKHNISIAKIPYVLFNTLAQNKIVAYQGKGTGRPIYEAVDEKVNIAVTVGSNGFVVGANPTSKKVGMKR